MFRKTRRKYLPGVLFSPVLPPRLGTMSIFLTVALPLALSGAGLPSLAANAATAPVAASVVAQPAKPVPVKAVATVPKSTPAATRSPNLDVVVAQPPAPPAVQLVKIQDPAPAPQAAPAMDRNAIVDRVSKALSDVKTAQGNFVQIDAQGVTSTGAFYISRPGKIRFDYDKPELMHIVSDGVSVSIEEPKRKSYDQVPLASTQFHLFLRSNVDLKRDGSVTATSTSNGSHFVTLVDKTGEADGKIVLEFRASDFELLGWRAITGSGEETKIRLSDTKKNVSLKPSLFIVKDPEDADHR